MPKGQCHCGAVRYEMSADTVHQAICHCADCRRHCRRAHGRVGAGSKPRISGRRRDEGICIVRTWASAFLPALRDRPILYERGDFPGQIDVQIATLDDPGSIVPQAQIQLAERIGWVDELNSMAAIRPLSGSLRRTESESRKSQIAIVTMQSAVVPNIPVIHRLVTEFFASRNSDAGCIVKR